VSIIKHIALTGSSNKNLLFTDKFNFLQKNIFGLHVIVIGHGIGGKVSQLKWRDSLKASRWSKRRRSVLVTRSHSQSTSDGSEDPLTLTPRIIGDSLRRISTTSQIEVSYKLLVSYELLKISWRR
jgi:hypothetical protein